jgi:hypothetical protein
VVGTPTAPTAICPAQLDTVPLTSTSITGSGEDDGQIVSYQWSLVSTPTGSATTAPSPSTGTTTSLLPDIAGTYRVQLLVTDNDGMTGTCTTDVRALNTEGLRVELFWDSAPDMDLHLLHPSATTWSTDLDCHWRNCKQTSVPDGLPWFTPATYDNPRLDLDDVTSYGPENINILQPAAGVYRVGVHSYNGDSQSVNVRVYCGGSTTDPIAEFGPVALPAGHLWRVVDIEIVPTGCNLLSLTNSDGSPNIAVSDRYLSSGTEAR